MSGCTPVESPETLRADLEKECKEYIAECEYVIKMLEIDPDFYAIQITVKDVNIGLTDGFSGHVISLLNAQIVEAQKCLAGEENGYE